MIRAKLTRQLHRTRSSSPRAAQLGQWLRLARSTIPHMEADDFQRMYDAGRAMTLAAIAAGMRRDGWDDEAVARSVTQLH